ncbi:MAG: hypothetical protein Q6373_000140 [Candidatus Sigynarchaeota archaeon]
MGKIRYMAKDRWRPIYRYPYGDDFVYLVCSLLAIGSSIGVYSALHDAIRTSTALFWILEVALLAGGLIAGFAIARYLFFVTPQVRKRSAMAWAVCAGLHFPGLYLGSIRGSSPVDIYQLVGAAALCAIAYVIAGRAFYKTGWIRLYTDGVIIGKLVLRYADFVYTEFACGKPYQDRVPEQGKGKPIVVLTPIDYEYVERDFGVTHYYCFIITRDTTYVAQSLTKRSDFVANVRNAWSCYDWEQRQKQK